MTKSENYVSNTFWVYMVNGLFFGLLFSSFAGVFGFVLITIMSCFGWGIFYVNTIFRVKRGREPISLFLQIMMSFVFLVPACLISDSIVKKNVGGGHSSQAMKQINMIKKEEKRLSTLPSNNEVRINPPQKQTSYPKPTISGFITISENEIYEQISHLKSQNIPNVQLETEMIKWVEGKLNETEEKLTYPQIYKKIQTFLLQ